MSDEKIIEAIKVECDRAGVGDHEQRLLYFAHHYLKDRNERDIHLELFGWILKQLATLIEPSNNGAYRMTPVIFNGVECDIPPHSIKLTTRNWIESFNEMLTDRREGIPWGMNDDNVEVTIKAFLDIHPFNEGNFRLAWLLRVWLLNQWDDPQPLPDYYA